MVLVVSAGWIALASRQSAGQKIEDRGQATEDGGQKTVPSSAAEAPPSFLNDPRLSTSPGAGLGNGELFFRMMLSVGLIIGLGAAGLYLSKRVLPKVAHAPGKEIHVLETAYLGPRKALHLVEVGGQRLLIASTNDRIAMLASMHEAWPDLANQELGEAAKA